jgi:DUF971 family protein
MQRDLKKKKKESSHPLASFAVQESELFMNEKPTGITANKQTREFTVTWSDNHTSVYSFELLRAACPCASCRGGHEKMKSEPDAEVFDIKLGDTPSTRISNVVAVGSYALTIVWEDGHDYGFITGTICGRCVPARKTGKAWKEE